MGQLVLVAKVSHVPSLMLSELEGNPLRAAHAAGAMVIMVPDVVTPTPEIAALCCGVATDLNQVAEILRREVRKD